MKYNLINRAEPPLLPPVLPSPVDILLESKFDEQEKIKKIQNDIKELTKRCREELGLL
jgi:hypothetical protein